uniref:Carbohydrate kinase FGGY C-terminal domain-containing protein n=1 Tax=Lactuca sativa TaxID=4236 RepID=A0A9R1WXJ5_LACSA|nr:hypothetical protein LSAT_V11C800426630 [Lactuca sativa]
MLGQACKKRHVKCTYRNGAFILLNTGEEVIKSQHGLLTTLAFKLGKHAPTNYALEGSIAIVGAAVQWLRDILGILSSTKEIEDLASNVTTRLRLEEGEEERSKEKEFRAEIQGKARAI